MTHPVHHGVYEALLDRKFKEALDRHPELCSVLGKVDFEEQPSPYAVFLAAAIGQALRYEKDPASRLTFCNRLSSRFHCFQTALSLAVFFTSTHRFILSFVAMQFIADYSIKYTHFLLRWTIGDARCLFQAP
jgi:hypothetical protein